MIDTNRIINALKHLNAKVAYSEDGTHIRFKGELPDSNLWAIHPNTFISEKNKAKWIRTIERIPMTEELTQDIKEPVKSLQEIIEGKPDFDAMTKKEIDDYALTLGIELDRRQTKADMITKLMEKI